ncbi:hypothetical protein ACX1C1_20270 [Paenibacillus sp. strain BS8-2]
MKLTHVRFRLTIGLLIIVLLAGCSKASPDYSDTYNAETDYQYPFYIQGERQQIAASETGYYFIVNNYIYYADRSNMKAVLLDGRPDSKCMDDPAAETEETCSAFVDTQDIYGYLTSYNGYLYTIQNKIIVNKDNVVVERAALFRMKKDGTERKKIASFMTAPLSNAIHRGKFYYVSTEYDANNNLTCQLKSFSLSDTPPKAEVLYEGCKQNSNLADIYPYGKYIYFGETGAGVMSQMRYDLESGNAVEILPGSDNTELISKLVSGVQNKQLIISDFNQLIDIRNPEGWHHYKTDLDGQIKGTIELNRNFVPMTYFDEQYIYARPSYFYLYKDEYKDIANEMTIYDKNERVLNTVDLSFMSIVQKLVVGDEHYMFAIYRDKENKQYVVRYLDKSKIGNESLAFEDFFEVPSQ